MGMCLGIGDQYPSMGARGEFDGGAAEGRDKGREDRPCHPAKHVLAGMPVEASDTVVALGTGGGYALRALGETADIGRGYGLDGAPEMARNAADYTDDDAVGFLVGDFDALPLADNSVDHVFSMEAFYYARDPIHTLTEIRRVLRPGGTFYCAVNYYEENEASHAWQDNIAIEMTRWNRAEYRAAFDEAGLHVAEQDTIADREIDIPPAEAFPTEDWETRAAMIDRYRTWGTLLTVGVAP